MGAVDQPGPLCPFWVLMSLPFAFPVNGDAVGAVDIEEERLAAGATVPAPASSSGADGSVTPALTSSGEAEEAASGSSAPPARAAVLALDALPPG